MVRPSDRLATEINHATHRARILLVPAPDFRFHLRDADLPVLRVTGPATRSPPASTAFRIARSRPKPPPAGPTTVPLSIIANGPGQTPEARCPTRPVPKQKRESRRSSLSAHTTTHRQGNLW